MSPQQKRVRQIIRDLAKCEPRPAPEVPEEWLDWARRTLDHEAGPLPGVDEDRHLAKSILAVRAKEAEAAAANARREEAERERDEWKAKAEKAETEYVKLGNRHDAMKQRVLELEVELVRQNSGDAKLLELRQFIERQRDHPTAGVQRTNMERALCGDAIAKIDRILSESPQPEPEAASEPVANCGNCAHFDVGMCRRNAPATAWLQVADHHTYANFWPNVSAEDRCGDQELARQSAKGAK